MKISAQSILASQNEFGQRIDTMLVTFPRFILAELNTHRMLSKNSASSRAIPTHKLLKMVEENPFIPIAWQKEHKGMQGTEYFTNEEFRIDIGDEFEYKEDIQLATEEFKIRWFEARDNAINVARGMNNLGLTKQLCNRLLEPFMWHTVLITGTEWDNFFELRCPQYEIEGRIFRSKEDVIEAEDNKEFSTDFKCPAWNGKNDDVLGWLQLNKGQAEIHMMALAEVMWDARNDANVQELKAGEWHIPFADKIDWSRAQAELERYDKTYPTDLAIKISTAMAARTSYTVVGDEKEVSYQTLIGIHDKMAVARPFHASPFEHCAKAMTTDEYKQFSKSFPPDKEGEKFRVFSMSENGWCRNFRGFIQYRHILESQA